MLNDILNIDENIIQKIKYSELYTQGTISYIDFYNEETESILFITPLVYISKIVSNSFINRIEIGEIKGYDEEFIDDFKKNILNNVLNTIIEERTNLIKNKSELRVINKQSKVKSLKLFFDTSCKIKVYDKHLNTISFNKINIMNKVKCVFSLKKFFVEKNYYGFILELIQIKSEEFYFRKCLFGKSKDEEEKEEKHIEILNDIRRVMSTPLIKEKSIVTKPPPPPPINKSISKKNKEVNSRSFMAGYAPSLQELLEQKNKLKKVNL